MSESAHDVLWRRLKYVLTPQHDIYMNLHKMVAGKRVLEVGFGTGAGVLQYSHAALEVIAVEVDPGAVHFASEMWLTHNVAWAKADITTMVSGEPFDTIIMIETLEHIPDYKTALQNIKQLLRPGGFLIMSSRNANADLRRWKDLHERELTAEQLVAMLEEFFWPVTLYDYTLEKVQDVDTRLTPLIAVAWSSQ